MYNRHSFVLTALLALGVGFSWFALIGNLVDFYNTHGTLAKVKDCVIPNPLVTPCFFGSLAFLASLLWSVSNIVTPSQKKLRYLSYFLGFSVIFAFSVVSIEFLQYYKIFGGKNLSCTPSLPPYMTPCFTGLIIFSLSFITAKKALNIQNQIN